MLRLIVMRHAKSAWDNDLDDHDRPLSERGQTDAVRVGEVLQHHLWVPDTILSSDSLRTRQTVAAVTSAWENSPPTKFSRGLYHAGIGRLQPLIAEQSSRVMTLMVVGHNPGWQAAVQWLCGQNETMSTANAVLMSSDEPTWPLAALQPWTLHDWLRPKELDRT